MAGINSSMIKKRSNQKTKETSYRTYNRKFKKGSKQEKLHCQKKCADFQHHQPNRKGGKKEIRV